VIPWYRTIWSRLWGVARKNRLDRQFEEELSAHLELLIDEHQREGLSPADARHKALCKLGRPASLMESHREQRGIPLLDGAEKHQPARRASSQDGSR
jgi:hypothetical protein